MKKLLRNKRMFLTLIAGMLVFVAVLGAGTFAWFTGKDTVSLAGDVYTAKVAVKATDMEITTYDFHPGVFWNIDVQQALEDTFGDDEAFCNEVFNSIYLTADPAPNPNPPLPHLLYGWNIEKAVFNKATAATAFAVVFDKVQIPPDPADFWGMFPLMPLVLVRNSFTYADAQAEKGGAKIVNLTPGSLLVGEYTFDVKGSSIPVYFRVQKAKFTTDLEVGQMVRAVLKGVEVGGVKYGDGMAAVTDPNATLINNTYATHPEYQVLVVDLKDGKDGYYYCNLPLSPLYAWEVEVKYDIYIYGEKNPSETVVDAAGNIVYHRFQDAKLEFVNEKDPTKKAIEVEVIQATNNAVYLSPEWKAQAGNVTLDPDTRFFVEYTDDGYGMYEIYKNRF